MASSTLRAYNNGLPRDDHVFLVLKGEPDHETAFSLCYHALSAGGLTFDPNIKGGARSMSNLFNLSGSNSRVYSDGLFGAASKPKVGGGFLTAYIGKDGKQPFFSSSPLGPVSISCNALFSNYLKLRTMLVKRGYVFETTSHAELVLRLMIMVSTSTSSTDLVTVIRDVCPLLQGSYSMVFLTKDKLVAVRDPEGSRPLFMGLRCATGGIVFTSENASLFYVNAHRLGEVLPGHLHVLEDSNLSKHYFKVNSIPILPSQDNFYCQQLYLRLTALDKTNLTSNPFATDFTHESVFVGIHGDPKASHLCLHALNQQWSSKQGHEAGGAGIVTFDDKGIPKSMTHVFEGDKSKSLLQLAGKSAIGYVGNNIQPFIAKSPFGYVAIAHNGRLSNYSSLRIMLQEEGYSFDTTSHAEVVLHLTSMISKSSPELVGVIRDVCGYLQGSYSMGFLTEDKLVVVRDSKGLAPLVMGLRCSTGAIVFTSEKGALDSIDAVYDEDVRPGYLYVVDNTIAKHHIKVKCTTTTPKAN